MTSELKVDKITLASGTNTQIGEAGDTTNLSAGTVTLPTTIITGQSAKTSLADADKFLISDSAASGAFKYVESQYIAGGSWNLIETEDLSSGSSVDINGFSSSYGVHAITWENVRSVVDNDVIKMMLLDSSGNNYQIYYGNVKTNLSETGGINGPTGNGTYSTNPHNVNLFGSVGSGSNEGVSGNMYLTGLPDANDAVLFWGNFTVFRYDNIYENYAIWGRGANLVVDKVRFYFNGGNFEHGTMKLYGLS